MGDELTGVNLTDRIGLGVLSGVVPRDLIDEVLAETGRVEQRRRLLPARVVVYYVMALCLFFGDAYEEVMRKLVGGLQFLRVWDAAWDVPTASALCQARRRLGEEPLRELFDRVAVPMLPRGRGWFGPWRVMAVDGVVLDMPDTADNETEFGRYRNGIAAAPFPQAQLVTLAECGSRAVVAAQIGRARDTEHTLFKNMLDRLDAGMLLMADRGYYGYDLWKQARASGAELLWRIQRRVNLPVKKSLPDGSYLSSVAPKSMRSDIARGKGRRIEKYELPVRVIEYTITNRGEGEPEIFRLITSILDHELAPAAEMATLYHQRWQIELAFDEIQTHQMGRPRVLRSRSPEMVRQEIWALLLTHYAIRHLMHEAAREHYVELDRISFMRSIRVIRRQVTDQAAFSPHPTNTFDPDRAQ